MSSNSAPKVSKVPVGATSVLGGGVTVAAYAGAVVAFIQGARDGETLTLLAVGTIGLVSTLAGRYGQAIAALLNAVEVATVAPSDPPPPPLAQQNVWTAPPAPPRKRPAKKKVV